MNATDMKSFINGLKCIWAERFTNEKAVMWETSFNYHLKKYEGHLIFDCNFKPCDVHTQNCFLNGILHAWSPFTFKDVVDNFRNQIIWNNHHIKVNRKILLYKRWVTNGIKCIKDIMMQFITFYPFQIF